MRPALTRLALVLTLVCGACAAPPALTAQASGTRLQVAPELSLLYHRSGSAWDRGTRVAPPGYGRGWSAQRSPGIVCDAFGRCWREAPAHDRFGYGYDRGDRYGAPPATRPPGWVYDLPHRARAQDRFLRPREDVVCDQATAICYKRGQVDKSETRDVFGKRAARRADDLRDTLGTARVFVPERGVACDRERRACFDDGEPDHGLTRRYFGRRAADDLD